MRLRAALVLSLAFAEIPLFAQTPPAKPKAIDIRNIDTSVKPCDDFYRYADGNWIKANPVPADKSRWGSFEELADRNRDTLKAILDEVSAKRTWPAGSIEQKVGDFYASGMDEAAIEKAGMTPLEPYFAIVGGVKSDADPAPVLGRLRAAGLGAGFGFAVAQDPRESTRYIGTLNQGGLGLPDRDYYLKDDPKSREIRDQYVAHVAKMLELTGHAHDTAAAEASSSSASRRGWPRSA